MPAEHHLELHQPCEPTASPTQNSTELIAQGAEFAGYLQVHFCVLPDQPTRCEPGIRFLGIRQIVSLEQALRFPVGSQVERVQQLYE